MENYVRGGFKLSNSGIELKCAPEFEARGYELSQTDNFECLEQIHIPVLVLCGGKEKSFGGLPEAAEKVAQKLETATLRQFEHLGHFGPFEADEEIANIVAKWFESIDGDQGKSKL